MSYQEIARDMIDKFVQSLILIYLVFGNLPKMFYDNEIPIIKELINAKNN